MRRHAAALATAVWLVACSSTPATFALIGASVDPTYKCPGGANNAAYDLHATIDARNNTSRPVTVESITAEMTLTATHGSWLEKVGERYRAEGVKFAPSRVAAGSTSTLKVTIPSACTSGKYGEGVSSSGDYTVTMHIATSAGAYAISARNQHQILAA